MTATGQHAADNDTDDGVLLARLRAGEDAAFGELFSRHSAAVRRLAFSLAGDRAEVDDLTAEAFFRVLQAIRRGSGPVDNVRGYLLLVTRRVAWEWRVRRRDVPVSDEELTHRAGTNQDTSVDSTERTLITRAFISLPERWRNVLWKVEVEGERPAVVGINIGLSANATAALARRARQGLRAAYLQAHLASDRSAAGCRSVLEKLGAYTAGCTNGAERRRIRAHLRGCPTCATMHDELRDVCSGLRANTALLVALGWVGLATTGAAGAMGVTVKGMFASAKVKLAVAASSVAAAGVLGIVAGPWGPAGDLSASPDDLDGRRGVELEITGSPPSTQTTRPIAVTTGALTTAISLARNGPARADRASTTSQNGEQPAAAQPPADTSEGMPASAGQTTNDEVALMVYRVTTIEVRTEQYPDYTLVCETISVTETSSAGQIRTYTHTTTCTGQDSLGMPAQAWPSAVVLTEFSIDPTATTTPGTPTTTTAALSSMAGEPSP
jgi:RNA polymerase sigma factor (sigma-70 family)